MAGKKAKGGPRKLSRAKDSVKRLKNLITATSKMQISMTKGALWATGRAAKGIVNASVETISGVSAASATTIGTVADAWTEMVAEGMEAAAKGTNVLLDEWGAAFDQYAAGIEKASQALRGK